MASQGRQAMLAACADAVKAHTGDCRTRDFQGEQATGRAQNMKGGLGTGTSVI